MYKNTDIGFLLRALDEIEISVQVNTLNETYKGVSAGQDAISRRFRNFSDLSQNFLSTYAFKYIEQAVSLSVYTMWKFL